MLLTPSKTLTASIVKQHFISNKPSSVTFRRNCPVPSILQSAYTQSLRQQVFVRVQNFTTFHSQLRTSARYAVSGKQRNLRKC